MDPLNLILLIIVVFIGLRLRAVLGWRDDDEASGTRRDAYRLNRDAFENTTDGKAPKEVPKQPPQDGTPSHNPSEDAGLQEAAEEPLQETFEDAPQPVASEPVAGETGRGLAYLRDVMPDLDEAEFLHGAGRAYEMILTAFADGDLSSVRDFLGADVAAGFDAAIEARNAEGAQLVTRVLRLDRPVLDDARLDDDLVTLDVRFRAELISFTRPQGAEIDEDNLPAPATAHDVWSFARPRMADDPNWVLVATQSA